MNTSRLGGKIKLIREYTDQNGDTIRQYSNPRAEKPTWIPYERYTIAFIGRQALKLGSKKVWGHQ